MRASGLLILISLSIGIADAKDRPNVILIMSDDQGVGDYGFMGNGIIRTPALDAMRSRGGLLSNFYVSPVCAPTRASLMTGRYNYRTRCVDTWLGRAMMDPDEVTLAELLRDAGYQTGIFGKWHLGDNYPMRAMDQGFQESLIHRGGGIGQPSDPIGAEGKYTDPTLIQNGVEVKKEGFCTDIFFNAALDFIARNAQSEQNFFAYISTNAPHGPFDDVPLELLEEYKKIDFSPIMVSELAPKKRAEEFDKLARIAAMITNIDQNVGRLFAKLEALGLVENTIVIYLNDNGPNTRRYVGEMRGMKTEVDDGGIRSPLIFHWPASVKDGTESDQMCAHIDVLPTILEACELNLPSLLKIDGRSFLRLLTQESPESPRRQLVFQSHRGDTPRLYHHFAIHEAPWKLVHPSGFGQESYNGPVSLELYNLQADPTQQHNLASEYPEVVDRLQLAYEQWFADVSSTREDNYAPPRIIIGTPHETQTVLTRQDWRHSEGESWAVRSNGFWLLDNKTPGQYRLEIIFEDDKNAPGTATIFVNDVTTVIELTPHHQRSHLAEIELPAGKIRLAVKVQQAESTRCPHQLILTAPDL